MKSKEMWSYLPPELVSNILIRLPVETLIRCTSVCKSWYSLITSPNFIATHLNLSNNQTSSLLLVSHLTTSNEFSWKDRYYLHCDNDTFDEFAQLDLPFIRSGKNCKFHIVGTCNGLVCLFDNKRTSTDKIILWNPSLKKSVTLPPNTSLVPRSRNRSRIWYWYSIGFGINPVTGDFKIVKLTYLHEDRPPEVELFELSTGSWRSINVSGDFPYISFPQMAFLNGVVHWTGCKKGGYCVVVSFDLRNESLGVVALPPCVQRYRSNCVHVFVFGESLSFLYGDGNSWCLWVMEEYGVESSWTKRFSIEMGWKFSRPVCFRGNGDILFERSGGREVELVSYDPKSKLIKKLNTHGLAFRFEINTYKESLVLTKGLNEVLGRLENSGGAVTCQGTSVLPREDNEVNGKRKRSETIMEEELQ